MLLQILELLLEIMAFSLEALGLVLKSWRSPAGGPRPCPFSMDSLCVYDVILDLCGASRRWRTGGAIDATLTNRQRSREAGGISSETLSKTCARLFTAASFSSCNLFRSRVMSRRDRRPPVPASCATLSKSLFFCVARVDGVAQTRS